jgi:ankyrin repeat protein
MPAFAVPFIDDSVEVHRLIRQGAPLDEVVHEIETNHTVNLRSPSGKTPLMTAAYYCRKDVMAALVKRGAVVNALDEATGDTAAHYVTLSMSGHIKQCACLMALIEHDADIELRNKDGYTVYELAAKNGNSDIGDTGDAVRYDE